jgi:hypothetical protein
VLNGEVSGSERRQQAQKTTRKLAESGKLRFSGSLKVGLGNGWWGNLIVDSSVPDSGKRASLHRALSASRAVPDPLAGSRVRVLGERAVCLAGTIRSQLPLTISQMHPYTVLDGLGQPPERKRGESTRFLILLHDEIEFRNREVLDKEKQVQARPHGLLGSLLIRFASARVGE